MQQTFSFNAAEAAGEGISETFELDIAFDTLPIAYIVKELTTIITNIGAMGQEMVAMLRFYSHGADEMEEVAFYHNESLIDFMTNIATDTVINYISGVSKHRNFYLFPLSKFDDVQTLVRFITNQFVGDDQSPSIKLTIHSISGNFANAGLVGLNLFGECIVTRRQNR